MANFYANLLGYTYKNNDYSFVTYSDSASVEVPLDNTYTFAQLKEAIQNTSRLGGTNNNLGQGITAAINEIIDHGSIRNRIVILAANNDDDNVCSNTNLQNSLRDNGNCVCVCVCV